MLQKWSRLSDKLKIVENSTSNTQLLERIEKALESIRPYLISDGGNVRLIGVTDEMIAQVELTGNCSNCRISNMTLKAGVEESILNMVPEIKGVEAIGN